MVFGKNCSKKCIGFLLALLTALALGVLAQASGQSGSVSLQLPAGQSDGVQMTLYTVADYMEDGTFVFREPFADCNIVLTDLDEAQEALQAAGQLAMIASQSNVAGLTLEAGADGQVVFRDLAPGYYLLAQTGGMDVLEVQKMLAPIPYMITDNELVYDVSLTPKYEVPEGAAILNKVDDEAAPLKDAQFVLQRKIYIVDDGIMPMSIEFGQDAEGRFAWEDYLTDLVTDENGQVAFSNLPLGTYRLVETKAPDGFFLNPAPSYFKIERGGQLQQLSGVFVPKSGTVAQLTVENTPTKVQVNKTDEEGNLLAGAKLVIMDSDDVGIMDEVGSPLYEFVTTEDPDVFKRLPPGDYYLREVQSPEGYTIAPDVPFSVSEDPEAVNEVTMVDPREEETVEKLTVTKDLVDMDGHALMASDSVFYVALFEDEARTVRVSDVKELHYSESSSAAAEFLNLEPGRAYYLGETDAFGDFVESGVFGSAVYAADYPDGYKVTLTQTHPEGAIPMTNTFYEIPEEGFYIAGEITVTKRVLVQGQASKSKNTYYAGIFTDPELTQRDGDVLEIPMNGGSVASVTRRVHIGTEPGSSMIYYVAETDKDGNVLDPDAVSEYTITIDNSEVLLTTESSSAEVVITNDFIEEEETEVTTEEETQTTYEESTTGGGTSSDEPGSPSSQPVKTGDDTPIALYVALLAAALVVLVIAVVLVRKRKK